MKTAMARKARNELTRLLCELDRCERMGRWGSKGMQRTLKASVEATFSILAALLALRFEIFRAEAGVAADEAWESFESKYKQLLKRVPTVKDLKRLVKDLFK